MGGCRGEKTKSEPPGEGGRPMYPPLSGLQTGAGGWQKGEFRDSEMAAGLPQGEGVCAESAESWREPWT